MRQTWVGLLANRRADGTAIVNTTTETAIYGGYTWPAGGPNVDDVLRVTLWAKYSNTGTPTLRIRARYGTGTPGSDVLLADTGAITTPSGVTNQPMRIQLEVVVREVGASGLFFANLTARGLGSATGSNLGTAGGATAPAQVSIDNTTAKQIYLTAEWGTASASNTLLGMAQFVESLG